MGSKSETKITSSVDSTYSITIPDSSVLKFEKLTSTSDLAARTKTFDVSASNVTLEPGLEVEVAVAGKDSTAFKMTNKNVSSVKLPYSITVEGYNCQLEPNTRLAVFKNNQPKTVTSSLVINAPTMGAGNYEDTLTFTCSIVKGPDVII